MAETPEPAAGEAAAPSRRLRPLLYGLVVLMLVLFVAVLVSNRALSRRAAGGDVPAFPTAGQPGVTVIGSER